MGWSTISKPFSRISIAVGEGFSVGRDVDDLEPYRKQVEMHCWN
jgi:lysophospholipid acyltransferase (LPLAT)-like uncharacterized protein